MVFETILYTNSSTPAINLFFYSSKFLFALSSCAQLRPCAGLPVKAGPALKAQHRCVIFQAFFNFAFFNISQAFDAERLYGKRRHHIAYHHGPLDGGQRVPFAQAGQITRGAAAEGVPRAGGVIYMFQNIRRELPDAPFAYQPGAVGAPPCNGVFGAEVQDFFCRGY